MVMHALTGLTYLLVVVPCIPRLFYGQLHRSKWIPCWCHWHHRICVTAGEQIPLQPVKYDSLQVAMLKSESWSWFLLKGTGIDTASRAQMTNLGVEQGSTWIPRSLIQPWLALYIQVSPRRPSLSNFAAPHCHKVIHKQRLWIIINARKPKTWISVLFSRAFYKACRHRWVTPTQSSITFLLYFHGKNISYRCAR
jgi:hypothetical protein